MKDYSPGRFGPLMQLPLARDLWDFLADDGRVRLMLDASDRGRPAIEPLRIETESRFGDVLSSPEYPREEIATFINNMVKHILEASGYEFVACFMSPSARYIKSSGLFRKRVG
jgi:hypothetical protein